MNKCKNFDIILTCIFKFCHNAKKYNNKSEKNGSISNIIYQLTTLIGLPLRNALTFPSRIPIRRSLVS